MHDFRSLPGHRRRRLRSPAKEAAINQPIAQTSVSEPEINTTLEEGRDRRWPFTVELRRWFDLFFKVASQPWRKVSFLKWRFEGPVFFVSISQIECLDVSDATICVERASQTGQIWPCPGCCRLRAIFRFNACFWAVSRWFSGGVPLVCEWVVRSLDVSHWRSSPADEARRPAAGQPSGAGDAGDEPETTFGWTLRGEATRGQISVDAGQFRSESLRKRTGYSGSCQKPVRQSELFGKRSS